jgi:methylthioribose-1-phosphate isomerase
METKMLVNGEQRTSIWTDDDQRVWIIDQRWLPHEVIFAELASLDDFYHSIKDMWVRGAPLIGVAAAFGLAKYMETDDSDSGISRAYAKLMSARPTAVNLQTGLDFICSKLGQYPEGERVQVGFEAALKFRQMEISISEEIGRNGGQLIQEVYLRKKRPINILTHCNAGWLATVDCGTATAPMYWASQNNIPIHVFVDETRPRNQGAQLTAWELGQNKVSHELVVDNAGGYLMQIGMVDMVIVGTDRTTAHGDVCNKIGTYLKALAAKDNDVPFYVSLPSTTIDWTINDGIKEIEIENRSEEEIHFVQGINKKGKIDVVRISPETTPALNPAFDVTPAKFITGLITEHGIIKANYDEISALKSNNHPQ